MKEVISSILTVFFASLLFFPISVSAHCHENLTDPAGDVYSLDGGPILDVSYVDITSAWVRPAVGYPAMELGVGTSEKIPYYGSYDLNIFYFFDSDRDTSNNALSGTRAGSDAAFSLMYSQASREWNTVVWDYNPETGEWTANLNPSVLFRQEGTGFIIHVPYSLFPENADWPWRVSVAATDSEKTAVDSAPNGEGGLTDCNEDGEQIIVSGIPEEVLTVPEESVEVSGSEDGESGEPEKIGGGVTAAPKKPSRPSRGETTGALEPETPGEPSGGFPFPGWGIGILIALLFGGGIAALGLGSAGKGAQGTPKKVRKTPPKEPTGGKEVPPPGTEQAPALPEGMPGTGEQISCTCKTCSMFLTIGSKDNAAIASAKNLGHGILRDTRKQKKDCCVKIAHFNDDKLKSGSYGTASESGSVKWNKFIGLDKLKGEDGYGEVCLWNEVMLVHHGEKTSHVKSILQNFKKIIPEAPIKRLILYYCGGEASLPQAEFNALAGELGRRLKKIPKKCRPSHVEIFMAPRVSFNDEPTYTKLSLQQQGLTSYQGMLMKYLVDENGNVTAQGNVSMKNKQVFGCVELGKLKNNPILDAEIYNMYWVRIAKNMKLSEIRRYRETIKRAKLDEPLLAPKEDTANKIEETVKKAGGRPFNPKEMDELVEKSGGEIKKRLKERLTSGK